MAWLKRDKSYDRSRILAAASRARKRRRYKKAIGLYRRILEVEPKNPDLHRRVAPLFAKTRQHGDAWASYQRAAEGLVREGFVDRAIGVYREASRYLPRELEVWRALADLEVGRGRRVDAVNVLLEGRRHFRFRRYRREALLLLLQARKIDPSHFAASYDLARLLARTGNRQRAVRLLESLVAAATPRQRRRARARLFWLSPTPAAGWRWLRALVGFA
ncbi:MAG: tetratricopeptide repeat protein [Myxococcales bacterium]|nr:tetratricopeptide repeat protein [Myxococcales bacterium]MDH5307363.1 tetratricopeptide repeat protein [Myxococcales bacterium]MDH5566189.1 tetratricopeptide repeat protein [Myxococcales bacterium]